MTDPGRAARWWLVVAVATLWLVSVGGVAADAIATSMVLDVTAVLGAPRTGLGASSSPSSRSRPSI